MNEGLKATSGQFPFHVAMFRELRYQCGGSLISHKAVVTAAHCVVNDNRELLSAALFRLVFGTVNLQLLTGTEVLREVARITRHPDYQNDKIIKHDIALMIISGNLQFSSSVIPICIFESRSPISNHINQRVTVLGFGANKDSREPNSQLHYGQMSIISREMCIESNLIFGL